MLPKDARAAFRAASQVDDEAWARGRGLTLSIALTALPYYQHTNPTFAAVARYSVAQILVEQVHEGR